MYWSCRLRLSWLAIHANKIIIDSSLMYMNLESLLLAHIRSYVQDDFVIHMDEYGVVRGSSEGMERLSRSSQA